MIFGTFVPGCFSEVKILLVNFVGGRKLKMKLYSVRKPAKRRIM